MKLEHDPGLGIQTPPRKSYNPFDSEDEDTDNYVRTNVNYDIMSFEKTADSLTFHMDTADLSWEEAILAHSQIVDHKLLPQANGDEQVSYRKDTELFTEKTITECELPELMVCYKDSPYNSVKDIGVDEGIPTHEKAWVKIPLDNQEKKSVPDFVDDLSHENHHETDESKKDLKQDLNKKETDSGGITGDDMKIADIVYDTGNNDQLSKRDELSKLDKKGNEASEGEYGVGSVTSEFVEEPSKKPSIVDSLEANLDSDKNQSKEAISSSVDLELPASEEPADTSTAAIVLPYNSTVESGSIILDFNSTSTALGNKEEEEEKEEKFPPNEVVAKPPEAQNMSRHEDGGLGGSAAISSMDKRVHGETSFSAGMHHPAASITYMGPHAHTGSVSLRSESSAGSTRSFAFPVLQAEWNSSPVRMAKADQRRMRRQKGWIYSLICCKLCL